MKCLIKIIGLKQSTYFMMYCCFGSDVQMFFDYKEVDQMCFLLKKRLRREIIVNCSPHQESESVKLILEEYNYRINQLIEHFGIQNHKVYDI